MDAYAAKHSYTVTCASRFRDEITALAARRRVNVADLARSVLLLVSAQEIAGFSDPGEPDKDDRDLVILKSGPSQGRPWRRKPRLQVRLPFGAEISDIRRALGIALELDKKALALSLAPAEAEAEVTAQDPAAGGRGASDELGEENERLRALVSVLAFEPLGDGIRSREDALHVLGFPPAARPASGALKACFRLLATIHHPDSDFGNHHRMSQLNEAMAYLQGGLS